MILAFLLLVSSGDWDLQNPSPISRDSYPFLTALFRRSGSYLHPIPYRKQVNNSLTNCCFSQFVTFLLVLLYVRGVYTSFIRRCHPVSSSHRSSRRRHREPVDFCLRILYQYVNRTLYPQGFDLYERRKRPMFRYEDPSHDHSLQESLDAISTRRGNGEKKRGVS